MTDLIAFTETATLASHLHAAAQARTLEGLVRDAKRACDDRLRVAIGEVNEQTGTAFTARVDGWTAVLTDPQPKPAVVNEGEFLEWAEDGGVDLEVAITEHVVVTDHRAAAEALRLAASSDVDNFGWPRRLAEVLRVEEVVSVPEDAVESLVASGRVALTSTAAIDTATGEVVPGVAVKQAAPTLQVRGTKEAKQAQRAELVRILGLPAELVGGDA